MDRTVMLFQYVNNVMNCAFEIYESYSNSVKNFYGGTAIKTSFSSTNVSKNFEPIRKMKGIRIISRENYLSLWTPTLFLCPLKYFRRFTESVIIYSLLNKVNNTSGYDFLHWMLEMFEKKHLQQWCCTSFAMNSELIESMSVQSTLGVELIYSA